MARNLKITIAGEQVKSVIAHHADCSDCCATRQTPMRMLVNDFAHWRREERRGARPLTIVVRMGGRTV